MFENFDEELLEQLYWEFDAARSKKSENERLMFKSKLRWFASKYAEETVNKLRRTENELVQTRNNHRNEVKRAALLKERPDLPVDRIPAYREMQKLQDEVLSLQQLLKTK